MNTIKETAPPRTPSTHDDDAESVFTAGEVAAENEPQKKFELAKKETKAVWYLRAVCFFLLGSFALAVCLVIYFHTSNQEHQDFEQGFEDVGSKLIESFDTLLESRFGTINSLASDFTAHARYTKKAENKTWPFVTLPDFQPRAQETAHLADVVSIFIATKVAREEKEEWDTFVQADKGWMEEGVAYLEGISVEELNLTMQYPKYISHRNASTGETGPEDGPGPYYVSYQAYPMFPTRLGYNRNLMAGGVHRRAINHIEATHEPALPSSFDYWGIPEEEDNGRRALFRKYLEYYDGVDYESDPAVNVYYPVFDSFDETRDLAAVLVAGIYWRSYFVNILPLGTAELHVVMSNTCDQIWTYVVTGNEAEFIGHGDLHDVGYTQKGISYDVNPRNQNDSLETGNCYYSFSVYPTKAFEESYKTSTPAIFSFSLAVVFLITSCVFLLYDYCVEQRQRKVMKSAEQSGTLVQSLFPEDVRDQLYQEQETKNAEAESQAAWTSKRLNVMGSVSSPSTTGGVDQSAAIAKLHPECTVLFADLAGFTQWSAGRTPTDVFALLEAIYGAFDRIAKRRGVFKVETIGDCYVAAAGLPTSQKNHAIIMAKFATECMEKLQVLIASDLSSRLGQDTANLKLRIGLHSGPVTAGVLRGEKSRFQIFGDTVNTASRMESNGEPGKIQVTQETADLIAQAGRPNWVIKRDELVQAKGKGDMQTFWVRVVTSTDTMSTGTFTVSSHDNNATPPALFEDEGATPVVMTSLEV